MAMMHALGTTVSSDGTVTAWFVDGVSVTMTEYLATREKNRTLLQKIVDNATIDNDGRLILPPGRITQLGLPYDPQNRPTVYQFWRAAFTQGLGIDVSGL